jgi:CMP-N,N'-diacetyllegionaminic acid synthase
VRVVAIVPARGGSKGIPRKNLVELGGRSLLAWAVRAGLEAGCVARTIVTTDDLEIAEAARRAGAEVPFLRPAGLAADDTTDLPVFQHALRWIAEHDGDEPDLVVHLRPTSPARRPGLVDAAVAALAAHPDATSLRSVSPSPVTPWKTYEIVDGQLRPLLGTLEEERFNQPRQALPEAWLHDGVIDVVRREVILDGSMSGSAMLAWHSDPDEAVDVDHPDDLRRAAEALDRLGADATDPAGS